MNFKIDKKQAYFLALLCFTLAFFISFAFTIHYYDAGNGIGYADWARHKEMYPMKSQLFYEGYPVIIYYFYPFFPHSLLLHVLVIIPALLFIYSKKLKANPFITVSIYYWAFMPATHIIMGFFKQILLEELILIIMILWVSKKHTKLFIIPAAIIFYVLMPIERIIGAMKFELSKWYQNIPFSSLPGALFYIPASMQMMKEKFWVLTIICTILFLIGMMETRIWATLFLIQLPFINKLIMNFIFQK